MTSNELNKILKANPTLTLHGYEDNLYQHRGYYENINKEQNPMTDKYLQEINACINWFRRQKMLKNTNAKRVTSYELKHHVETESKMYIPAGCMIVACIFLETPFTRIKGSPDVWIPIQKKIR